MYICVYTHVHIFTPLYTELFTALLNFRKLRALATLDLKSQLSNDYFELPPRFL